MNMGQVVKEINEKTSSFAGMKVPVEIEVDTDTKRFEVRVGTPPTSMLILRELKLEKGSSDPKTKKVGNLSMKQVIEIARMKLGNSNSNELRNAVKQVLGTALSMGVTIEGKDPRIIQKEVDSGLWDNLMGG